MRITVGNLKGGTAKTTSAVFLALGLARSGRTLLVDADPQASALDWTTQAGDNWPASVTVIPWATRDLARRVGEVAPDYAHVVIDTGPQHDQILRQALLATDHLVIPVAPSPIELHRLSPTFDLAAEIDSISVVYARVLLAKVDTRTRQEVESRTALDQMRLPVMTARTRTLQRYPLAWGTAPEELGDYDEILSELAKEDT